MSGLVKAKKYDWKDSNLALFGSDTEKQVKKESAESEQAWQGAGESEGLRIWRIVNFKVTEWSKNDYGKFYSGDSYIILNTYKEQDGEQLLFDVHFWIGSKSSQDEYGTAAYKTVELDTLLDDAAVQHREVQGYESTLFRSYFKNITIMEGGADSGFNHVTPEEYTPRLLHFHGKGKNISASEVPLCASRLRDDDVFILDMGKTLYQWNGKTCNMNEKFRAMQFLTDLKSERAGSSETFDQGDDDGDFLNALTGIDEEDDDDDADDGVKRLFRVSVESGDCDLVKEGDDISTDDLDSSDVFLLDSGKEVYVWIGCNASPEEKKNGLPYAHKHLMGTGHPLSAISVVKEGRFSAGFNSAMAA